MKKNNLLSLICILTFTIANSQTTPQQMVANMQAGINLGNVLSAPQEGNWSPAVEEQYFIDVATAGFSNVRIPMDFYGIRTTPSTTNWAKEANTASQYTGSISDYTVSATYLDRVEEVVDWALNQGLITILDLHGSDLKKEFHYTFDRKNRHPDEKTSATSAKRLADLDKLKAIWTAIANRLKNKSDKLLFEVINEPYFEITDTDLNAINSSIISIIRGSGGNNATRNIVITGGTKNSFEAPTTIAPSIISGDNYLIATYHYYNPNSFTKSSRDDKDKETWGTTADKNKIDADFGVVKTWADGQGIPVLMGEFGADNTGGYNYSTGDLNTISGNATGFSDGGPKNDSRVEFHRYLAQKAIALGFAFSVWDAGPESNKTINKRSDSPSTTNYNIANFSVTSYSPKNTTASTVIDNSVWVEDVKDALLSSVLSVNTPTFEDIAIHVYPNPANNYLYIKSKKEIKNTTLYSSIGSVAYSSKSNLDRIDTSQLTAGIYFLQVSFKNSSTITKKIVIGNH